MAHECVGSSPLVTRVTVRTVGTCEMRAPLYAQARTDFRTRVT